jgi:acetyl-CoA carboxylase biotin carboxyl carrier protein
MIFMDLRKLKTLIDLVSESNVAELEITEPEGKVRIVKSSGASQPAQAYSASGVVAMPVQSIDLSAANPPAPVVEATPSVAQAPATTEAHVVKSPMVGTFYRSASPEAAPFVEVGSVVKEGDTICIVEAMKILNEIEADKSGTITKIYAQNAQAVEYGSALFAIE